MRSGFSPRMSGSDSFGEKNSSLLSIFPAVCYSAESIFWKILLAQQHWRPSHFSMFLNQISKAKLTWGFPDFWQNSGLQLGVWGNLGAIPGHNLLLKLSLIMFRWDICAVACQRPLSPVEFFLLPALRWRAPKGIHRRREFVFPLVFWKRPWIASHISLVASGWEAGSQEHLHVAAVRVCRSKGHLNTKRLSKGQPCVSCFHTLFWLLDSYLGHDVLKGNFHSVSIETHSTPSVSDCSFLFSVHRPFDLWEQQTKRTSSTQKETKINF